MCSDASSSSSKTWEKAHTRQTNGIENQCKWPLIDLELAESHKNKNKRRKQEKLFIVFSGFKIQPFLLIQILVCQLLRNSMRKIEPYVDESRAWTTCRSTCCFVDLLLKPLHNITKYSTLCLPGRVVVKMFWKKFKFLCIFLIGTYLLERY